MRTTTEHVSPEQAAQWLAQNYEHNRAIRSSRVASYASDMRAGRWQLTHQGIAFDEAGRLIDGQHRLMAVVESGATVPMNVTTDTPIVGFVAMDRHSARSVADVSSDPRVTTLTVAVARALMAGPAYASAGSGIILPNGQRYNGKDPQTVIPFLINNWHAISAVFSYRPGAGRLQRLYPAPVMAAFTSAVLAVGLDRMEPFLVAYANGQGESDALSNAILLRELMAADLGAARGARQSANQFRKAQSAVSAFLEGTRIARLRGVENDRFPLPAASWAAVPQYTPTTITNQRRRDMNGLSAVRALVPDRLGMTTTGLSGGVNAGPERDAGSGGSEAGLISRRPDWLPSQPRDDRGWAAGTVNFYPNIAEEVTSDPDDRA